jgi:hypothetical protein
LQKNCPEEFWTGLLRRGDFDRRDMKDRRGGIIDGITKLVLKLTEFLRGVFDRTPAESSK